MSDLLDASYENKNSEAFKQYIKENEETVALSIGAGIGYVWKDPVTVTKKSRFQMKM